MTDATRLTRDTTQTGIAYDNDHLAYVFKVDIDSTEVTASQKVLPGCINSYSPFRASSATEIVCLLIMIIISGFCRANFQWLGRYGSMRLAQTRGWGGVCGGGGGG